MDRNFLEVFIVPLGLKGKGLHILFYILLYLFKLNKTWNIYYFYTLKSLVKSYVPLVLRITFPFP